MNSRKRIYRENLFEKSCFTSLQAVEDALYEFEGAVAAQSSSCAASVLADLLSEEQFILPLVLSNVGYQVSTTLHNFLLGLFTVDAGDLSRSVAYQVLSNLSLFLLLAPVSLPDRELQAAIAARHNVIQTAPEVLQAVSTMEFPDNSPIDADDDAYDFGFQVRRKKKSKQQRRLSVSVKSKALDTRPFKTLGYPIPNNRSEAESVGSALIRDLQNALDFYLDILRSESLANSIMESCVFIRKTVNEEEKHDSGSQDNEVVTETALPSAYPKVQPMKSALHFDSVEGFGEWVVLISQNADNDLRTRHKKDKKSFDIIVKKIRELSNGHFSADNHKRLSGPGLEVPIFEAKMTGDLRLVYQVDVVASDDQREQQAVKIFGVYTHAQMDSRMWHSLGNLLGRKGKEYRDRCSVRVRAQNADDQTFIPASFPPLPEETEENGLPNLLSDDTDPLYSRLLMDKYVVFSQPLLNTMLADLEATFPHLVSSQEKLIIEHPYSCYVIGRSGTGKTTTLLFKMLLVERSHQMAGGDMPRPRQIFVTQSRLLAKKVEQYFTTLVRSLAATSQSLDELRLLRTGQGASALDDEGDMIDVDDVADWSGDLPARFSELEDKHFPLFTTFNGLCTMLEADIASTKTSILKKPATTITRELDSTKQNNLTVSYDVFLHHYWTHFPQQLTKRLDPSLVFSELIGVIKGSEETLTNDVHHLTHSDYRNMSTRTQSTFSESRDDLYALFSSYLTRKKKLGAQDGADRTHSILDFFKSNGVPGQKIDHLYVDEVQDNLLIDTLVLRAICHDANGLFWAGDTAQTISVGSSFRFNSLKAFQWRLEEQRRQSLIGFRNPTAIQPEIFQLAVNYRSHAGIVDCAHSVIDLISRFWPDSIDKLAPEKGVIDGLKPVFFVGWDQDEALELEQFIFGDSGNRIEFGAQQCILVRDDAAREKLKEKVGNIGLVMTIYESKGLEFNDVLLYDFFEDSPAQLAQWRVILNGLDDTNVPTPDFERNKSRYASICVELKFLYVAITRARENLWIADSSDKGESLRMYWTKRDLIRSLTPGMNAPRLATSSPPEEWNRQGRHLFERKKYAEAKHCFERALRPESVAIAHAYVLRETAERLSNESRTSKLKRKDAFCLAAEAFRKCSDSASQKRRLDFLKICGNCYEKANELLLAAQAYYEAQMFTEAALCYRDLSYFDEAVKLVKEVFIKKEVAENIFRLARIFYSNQIQSLPSGSVERTKKLQHLSGLFESIEDLFEYLEERDFDIALAAVLEANGKIREAAELHLTEGRTLDAIALFLKDEDEDSSRRATDCILTGLWQKLIFGSLPGVSDTNLTKLLDLASRANVSLVANDRNEIRMFQAIRTSSMAELRELSTSFFLANNRPAALLCLDHYFTNLPRFNNLSIFELAEELRLFQLYTEELHQVLTHPSPAESKNISKLFGFQKLSESENHVMLPQGTYLHECYMQSRKTLDTMDQDMTLSYFDFQNLFRTAVRDRLRMRILKEVDASWRCPVFTPCLTFAIFGDCQRPACPQAHVTGSSMDPSYYNTRVRAHLLQISILNTLFMLQGLDFVQRREWLLRLYDAILPPHYIMGTSACLDLKTIPEADQACRVVRWWVQGFVHVHSYSFQYPSLFLTDLLQATVLAQIFDKDGPLYYLHRGRYAFMPTPSFFIRPGGGAVIHELVGTLERHFDSCLIAGIFSIMHVVKQQLSIDLGVLCDFLDHLCKNLILSNSSQRNFHPHNVTVPRSWLSGSAIGSEIQKRKQVGFLSLLMNPIEDLLRQIYTGGFAEYLLYERTRNFSMRIPNKIRTIFITRICRSICLLGYNIQNIGLRGRILQTITSLRFVGHQPFPSSYSRYANAMTWDDLARAVRGSTRNSTMDEMVQLLHKGASSQTPRAPWGVRQVVYDKLDDIPGLLRGTFTEGRQSTGPDATPVAAPIAVVPNQPALPSSEHAEATEMEDDGEGEADDVEEEEIEDVPEQAISNMISVPPTEEPEIPEPTEEEQKAAIKIQAVYRRYKSHQTRSKNQLIGLLDTQFVACLREGQQVKSGCYRKMMLGPLPHVLVALELLFNGIMNLKHKTKQRMRLPLKNEEIDTLDQQLTRTNAAVKEIKDLQKKLGARSSMHPQRNIGELKKLIEDMQRFVRNDLPVGVSPETMAEFEIGYKGIVKEAPPKVASKPPKPQLNTEDIYEF